ncbi:bifunctional ADP-dependent NAD(P)H-hydrate dehydratase/NAD(P)H-hydrate epimerase [Geoglobus acetivorans]|uniref:Bifunctional NAD(P)H-hydrate repair enzyme n=1 Tax=Geoglobus acetivorans TaxID=565033 RepID=A0A0A7GCJ9_GEOAI|nr:carbohydrate kinase [Geoglobus acetivorans]
MHETIDSRHMNALDLNCEFFGLSRLQLMENAGKGVAEEILSRFDQGRVVIFAGTGNNGGDAFVAARFLKGFDVEIVLAGEVKSELARRNLSILEKAGLPVHRWGSYEFGGGDIIVDALLGTGIRGKLREPYRTIIERINESDGFKVSVDVPSGLDADTGEYETAVRADLTVTFHRAKPGLFRAGELAGEIVVKDIGIPELFEKLSGPGDFKLAYRRFEDAHKGMHGRVLVVGGSPYIGAPVLSALAALKAGADIVTLAVPESIYPLAGSFSPELIVKSIPGDELTAENVSEILRLAEKHDVVVFGMGTVDKGDVAEEISKRVEKMVIDAGGLTSSINCSAILTPHAGEFRRVFGKEASEINVIGAAEKSGTCIILKGKRDIISDGERIKYNDTGNAGMTVGGTGDVLAGIAGALFAVNDDAFTAACASAFIAGYAGDLCFEEKGYNFTALDVIEKLPHAVKKIMELK